MDVSDEARQIGIDSGDALFLTYLNKYPTYGDALIAFTKDNPGKAIYAVSKYENTAFYQSNLETQNFIEKNMDEFKARPVGLSHFAPVEGTYGGLASFYFMRANGIKVPKTVETYFNETMQAAGQAEMDWIDTQADQVRVGASPEMLRTIDKTVTEAKKQVLDRFPLAEYQKKSSDEIQQSAQRQVQEISQTARFMVSSGQDSDGRAAKYLDAHNVYLQARNAQDNAPIGDAGKKYRSGVTEVWKLYISNQALPQFAGDDRGTRYLRLLSQALNITKIEGL